MKHFALFIAGTALVLVVAGPARAVVELPEPIVSISVSVEGHQMNPSCLDLLAIPDFSENLFTDDIFTWNAAEGVDIWNEDQSMLLASIHGLLESKSITKRKLTNALSKIASALVNNSSSAVSRELISDGWHETRALYLTGLVESLIIKCEWNIDYENQIAEFSQLLKQNNWQDDEVALMISPVQELIKKHGGRLTRSGITRSITRNVIYIIILLILTPIAGWMLFTFEVLEDDVKYEIIKFLILVIPALGALIYNLVQIARRRRRGK